MNPTDPPVITRFAPSPTGQLHVGGARTALYSYAFARKHGGKFLLRFEDTDQKRSSKQAEHNILRDLDWLGLRSDNWDDIPRQSQRLDRYNQVVEKLLVEGRAYEDEGAIRFRMCRAISFDDAVYGQVSVEAKDLEDFVIRKADGYPTFHLAVVVDDADMHVTHVIRGQEHLSNTPKHVALQDALGFARPIYAHTPSIMNPDGSKMSKRDKAKAARAAAVAANLSADQLASDALTPERVYAFLDKQADDMDIATAIAERLDLLLPEINVADFEISGYLPEVLLNYLSLLGWNPGNDVERFDLDFMVQHFSLERVNKANSKFDREKLLAFNADTLQKMPADLFAQKLRAFMQAFEPKVLEKLGPRFEVFAQAYQPRTRTLRDPAEVGAFLFWGVGHTMVYDDKAVKKNLLKNEGEGLQVLKAFGEVLAALEPWEASTIHAAIEAFTAEKGLKNMGSVAQPLRVALTGTAVSPPIDVTLALLGKKVTLDRIKACVDAHKH